MHRGWSLLRVFTWFCCKKSGYFTKPVKNITNRIFICHKQVNNDTKSNSYSSKRQQNYFCNGTRGIDDFLIQLVQYCIYLSTLTLSSTLFLLNNSNEPLFCIGYRILEKNARNMK